MSRVEQVAGEIRRLQIQGANAIAKAGLTALATDLAATPEADGKELAETLKSARPNEPMLRNLLDVFLALLETEAGCPRAYEEWVDTILRRLAGDEERLASAGAELIRDGMTVFTHCHSSTAVGILKAAHREGRRFRVFNTETRPRFQGRLTAAELAGEGLEVIHMVDAAAKYALDRSDLFIFGADAVLRSGYLINKVGTGIFCVVASRYDVPVYCATHTLKLVRDRFDEPVEQRDPAEVWPKAPAGIEILNPAFDKVHLKYVTAFVTERGITHDILSYDPVKSWME